VRIEAAHALIGSGHAKAIPADTVGEFLASDDPALRLRMLEVFATKPRFANDHAEALTRFLEDDYDGVRGATVHALAAMRDAPFTTVLALYRHIEDAEVRVGWRCRAALIANAEHWVPTLARATEETEGVQRLEVVWVLRFYASHSGVARARLAALTLDPDAEVRAAATLPVRSPFANRRR
jgi:hypothetical protein